MKKLSIVMLAGLLAACSSGVKEPTEAELIKVAEDFVTKAGKQTGKFSTLVNFKKENCKKLDDNKFECSYTFETTTELGGSRQDVFVKRDGSWFLGVK